MSQTTQAYTPSINTIVGVTRGITTLVTTGFPITFDVGSEVLFSIPSQWGITQLNGLTSYVSSIEGQTFKVPINSITFDAFVTPTATPPVVIQPAQVLPIGDQNTGYLSPGGIPPSFLSIPGAFGAPPPA